MYQCLNYFLFLMVCSWYLFPLQLLFINIIIELCWFTTTVVAVFIGEFDLLRQKGERDKKRAASLFTRTFTEG